MASSVIVAFAAIVIVAIMNGWETTAFIFGLALLVYGCNVETNPHPILYWSQGN